MKSKKQLIIWILKILESSTDEKNTLTQTKIAEMISTESHPCDRKTVCRNIKFLQDMGYPIIKTKPGFYMANKPFSVEELQFVKAAILSSPNKTEVEKAELSERVERELSRIYKR